MKLSLIKNIRNRSGQVAVILILITAIALIFYAVSLNLGRVSQLKGIVNNASTSGASLLASQMASTGQRVFISELNRQIRKCGPSGVARAMFRVFAVIATIVTLGAATPLLIASLVISIATTALQTLIVEPAITNQWELRIAQTMETSDQFAERGIQTGLQNVISDGKRVDDAGDINEDGFTTDQVSRYAVYYDKNITDLTDLAGGIIGNFLDELAEIMYAGIDGWGLYDPLPDGAPCPYPLSVCDECCQRPEDRPANCGGTTGRANPIQRCRNNSPYPDLPWVYDPIVEQPGNGFISAREQIGMDDERRGYTKLSGTPNMQQNGPDGSPFHVIDTTGYYNPNRGYPSVPPLAVPNTDLRMGVFKFFYHSFDGLDYNGRLHRLDDSVNPDFQTTTIPSDFINLPTPDDVFATDDYCAQQVADGKGFWKKGGDNYCSATYPYFANCPKHNFGSCSMTIGSLGTVPIDCACGQGGTSAAQFPDDVMDDIVYGLDLFIRNVDFSLNKLLLNKTIAISTVDEWGKAMIQDLNLLKEIAGPKDTDGRMDILWRRLNDWLEGFTINPKLVGSDCEDVWCIPSDKNCDLVWPDEEKRFEAEGAPPAGYDGDWKDVLYCLDYNANGPPGHWYTSPGSGGNDVRFQNCIDQCNTCADTTDDAELVENCVTQIQAKCVNNTEDENGVYLPRSLVPDSSTVRYDPTGEFLRLNPPNITLLQTNAACSLECAPLWDDCIDDYDACIAAGTQASTCNTTLTTCQSLALCSDGSTCDPVIIGTSKKAALGACGDDVFMAKMAQSQSLAVTQVTEFKDRLIFLRYLFWELRDVIGALYEPLYYFDEDQSPPHVPHRLTTFLSGPAQAFIDNRAAAAAVIKPMKSLIYGWKDDQNGNWHIAKVDSAVPKRCSNKCGINGAEDPAWPDLISEGLSWFGLRRCYHLDPNGTNGLVKLRVTRFDESKNNAISFANNVQIWKARFTNPNNTNTAPPATDLDAACGGLEIASAPGAFMLREAADGPGCWVLANQLLSTGMMQETCGQYEFKNPKGYDFKFVNCPSGSW